jgi:hypothetical protein
LSGAVAKPASIDLRKLVLSPTGSINLGFILRKDLLLCSSYLPLGVPNWAVNYTPSVFEVPAGQLLGFIVSHRGIKVNPEKIKAILDISRPNDLKDVHRLIGYVAAVSRFISRLGEKALPLYKLMKNSDEFVWTDEADAMLKDLKRVLSTAPVPAAPEDQEPMLLYMAATNRVVIIVIVVECKEEAQEYGVQRPVYYVSEVDDPQV